jgi:hypothetical protein
MSMSKEFEAAVAERLEALAVAMGGKSQIPPAAIVSAAEGLANNGGAVFATAGALAVAAEMNRLLEVYFEED